MSATCHINNRINKVLKNSKKKEKKKFKCKKIRKFLQIPTLVTLICYKLYNKAIFDGKLLLGNLMLPVLYIYISMYLYANSKKCKICN